MSKPRERWWGYVRNILYAYPRISRDPAPSEMDRMERDAVAQALAETARLPSGELRISLIRMVFFERSHTLEAAAEQMGVCYPIARRVTGAFIRLVWARLSTILECKSSSRRPVKGG